MELINNSFPVINESDWFNRWTCLPRAARTSEF